MASGNARKDGLRERKRQETLERITRVGLRMFVEKGFDATTLEQIAVAAKVSPRTLFYYFKTKEDVVLHLQGNDFTELLSATILDVDRARDPLDAISERILRLVSEYETPRSRQIAMLLRSTERLRRHKQVVFANMEAVVFEALCTVWPEPNRRASLRLLSMIAIGTMRIGMDKWHEDNARRPLVDYVRSAFAQLRKAIRDEGTGKRR